MGSDINSSSGTEPAVKRTPDEPADVTRGAGYQLAADANKNGKINALDATRIQKYKALTASIDWKI